MIKEILPSIFLVRPPGKESETAYTYVLKRPTGSILFATKVDVSPFIAEITALGPVEHILLGDRHHAVAKTAAIARRLGSGLSCSAIEASALRTQGVDIANALPYERTLITPDLEAIPTPGHTRGAFSYLWKTKNKKYLFVGDTLVPVERQWKYWVTRPNVERMRETVQMLSKIEFDTVLCNSFAATPRAWIESDARYRKTMFAQLAADLAK